MTDLHGTQVVCPTDVNDAALRPTSTATSKCSIANGGLFSFLKNKNFKAGSKINQLADILARRSQNIVEVSENETNGISNLLVNPSVDEPNKTEIEPKSRSPSPCISVKDVARRSPEELSPSSSTGIPPPPIADESSLAPSAALEKTHDDSTKVTSVKTRSSPRSKKEIISTEPDSLRKKGKTNKKLLRRSKQLVETSTQTADIEFISIRTGDENPSYVCLYCHQIYSEITDCKIHELTHAQKRKTKFIKCQFCSKKLPNIDDFKCHATRHHPDLFHLCVECDIRFDCELTLSEHKGKEHAEPPPSSTSPPLLTLKKQKQSNSTILDPDTSFDASKKLSTSPRHVQKVTRTEEQVYEAEMLFYSHLSGNIQENLSNHLDGKIDRSDTVPDGHDGADVRSKSGSLLSVTAAVNGVTPSPIIRAPSPYQTRSKTPNPLPTTAKKFKKLPNWQQKFWEKYNFPTNYRYEHRFWDKNYLNTEKSALYLKDLSCLDIKTQLTLRQNAERLEVRKAQIAEHHLEGNDDSFLASLNLIPGRPATNSDSTEKTSPTSKSELPAGGKKGEKGKGKLLRKPRLAGEGQVMTRRQSGLENGRQRKGSLDMTGGEKMTLRRQASLELTDSKKETVPLSSVTPAAKDPENRDITNIDTNIISGEWVRPRSYLCGTCCAKFSNLWELEDHKWASHPNVWCTHYEFEDEKLEKFFKLEDESPQVAKIKLPDLYHRSLEPQGSLTTSATVTATLFPQYCSKCEKSCQNQSDLHKHMLECGGDTTWFLTMHTSPGTMKRKWRPFGSKRRKQIRRRGLKRTIPATPTLRNYCTQPKIRTKPGDVETIQKMLANLPEKRARRAINFDEISTRSQATIHSNRLLRKRFNVTFGNNFFRRKALKTARQQQQQQQARQRPGSSKTSESGSKSTSDISEETTPNASPRRTNRLKEVTVDLVPLSVPNAGTVMKDKPVKKKKQQQLDSPAKIQNKKKVPVVKKASATNVTQEERKEKVANKRVVKGRNDLVKRIKKKVRNSKRILVGRRGLKDTTRRRSSRIKVNQIQLKEEPVANEETPILIPAAEPTPAVEEEVKVVDESLVKNESVTPAIEKKKITKKITVRKKKKVDQQPSVMEEMPTLDKVSPVKSKNRKIEPDIPVLKPIDPPTGPVPAVATQPRFKIIKKTKKLNIRKKVQKVSPLKIVKDGDASDHPEKVGILPKSRPYKHRTIVKKELFIIGEVDKKSAAVHHDSESDSEPLIALKQRPVPVKVSSKKIQKKVKKLKVNNTNKTNETTPAPINDIVAVPIVKESPPAHPPGESIINILTEATNKKKRNKGLTAHGRIKKNPKQPIKGLRMTVKLKEATLKVLDKPVPTTGPNKWTVNVPINEQEIRFDLGADTNSFVEVPSLGKESGLFSSKDLKAEDETNENLDAIPKLLPPSQPETAAVIEATQNNNDQADEKPIKTESTEVINVSVKRTKRVVRKRKQIIKSARASCGKARLEIKTPGKEPKKIKRKTKKVAAPLESARANDEVKIELVSSSDRAGVDDDSIPIINLIKNEKPEDSPGSRKKLSRRTSLRHRPLRNVPDSENLAEGANDLTPDNGAESTCTLNLTQKEETLDPLCNKMSNDEIVAECLNEIVNIVEMDKTILIEGEELVSSSLLVEETQMEETTVQPLIIEDLKEERCVEPSKTVSETPTTSRLRSAKENKKPSSRSVKAKIKRPRNLLKNKNNASNENLKSDDRLEEKVTRRQKISKEDTFVPPIEESKDEIPVIVPEEAPPLVINKEEQVVQSSFCDSKVAEADSTGDLFELPPVPKDPVPEIHITNEPEGVVSSTETEVPKRKSLSKQSLIKSDTEDSAIMDGLDRRSRRRSKEVPTTNEFIIDDPLLLVDELWSELDSSDSESKQRKKIKRTRKRVSKKKSSSSSGVDLEALLRNFGENKDVTEDVKCLPKKRPGKAPKTCRERIETKIPINSKSFKKFSSRLFTFNKKILRHGRNGAKLLQMKKVLIDPLSLPKLPFLHSEVTQNPEQVIICRSSKNRPVKRIRKLSENSQQIRISLPLELISDLSILNNNHPGVSTTVELEPIKPETSSRPDTPEIKPTTEVKPKRSEVIDKIFYCEICHTYYYSPSQLKNHKMSNRHKLKEMEFLEGGSEEAEIAPEPIVPVVGTASSTTEMSTSEIDKAGDDTCEMPILEGPFIETRTEPPPSNAQPTLLGFTPESLKEIQKAIGCSDEEMLLLTLFGENNTTENEAKIDAPDIRIKNNQDQPNKVAHKNNGILKIDLKQRMTTALASLVNRAVNNLLSKSGGTLKADAANFLSKLSDLSDRRKSILTLSDDTSATAEILDETTSPSPSQARYKYQCTICGNRFEKESTRDFHLIRTHRANKRPKPQKPPVEQLTPPSEDWIDTTWFDNDEPAAVGSGQFWCSDCGINFLSPAEVREHQQLEHPPERTTVIADETDENRTTKRLPELDPDQERLLANQELQKLSSRRVPKKCNRWGLEALKFTVQKPEDGGTQGSETSRKSNLTEIKYGKKLDGPSSRFCKIVDSNSKKKGNDDGPVKVAGNPDAWKAKSSVDVYDFNDSESDVEPVVLSHVRKTTAKNSENEEDGSTNGPLSPPKIDLTDTVPALLTPPDTEEVKTKTLDVFETEENKDDTVQESFKISLEKRRFLRLDEIPLRKNTPEASDEDSMPLVYMSRKEVPVSSTDLEQNDADSDDQLNGNVIYHRNDSVSSFSDVSKDSQSEPDGDEDDNDGVIQNDSDEMSNGKAKRKIVPLLSATLPNRESHPTRPKANKEAIVRKIWNRPNKSKPVLENEDSSIDKDTIMKRIWKKKKLDLENESVRENEEVKINQTEISDEVVIKCGPKPKTTNRRKSANEQEPEKDLIVRRIWSGKCTFQTKAALKTYDTDIIAQPVQSPVKRRGRPSVGNAKRKKLISASEDDLDSLLDEIEQENVEKAIRIEFLHLRRTERSHVGESPKDLFTESQTLHNSIATKEKKRRKLRKNIRVLKRREEIKVRSRKHKKHRHRHHHHKHKHKKSKHHRRVINKHRDKRHSVATSGAGFKVLERMCEDMATQNVGTRISTDLDNLDSKLDEILSPFVDDKNLNGETLPNKEDCRSLEDNP